MTGVFMCCCSNEEMERILEEESAQKANCGEYSFPATSAGDRTRNLVTKESGALSSIQSSPSTSWVVDGTITDDSAETLFRSFLRETIVSSSDKDRDVHLSLIHI